MKVMQVEAPGQPLRLAERPDPQPGPGEIAVRVDACAVCRTDLHLMDGELPAARLPFVPGHEIAGTVLRTGSGASRWRAGDRVGIAWLGWTCGECAWCARGAENLCERARFTGWQIDGGYAEQTVADERFVFPLPVGYDAVAAAPLLCAGLIGYRALRAAGDVRRLGLYGFGAAAHLIAQAARFEGREVYAFVRPGDAAGAEFARSLGAAWVGGSDESPPQPLHAAIIFAPVGALIPMALKAVGPGGTVVCAGIHMSEIPSFPYELLWKERAIRSVANLTRRDGAEFLALAPKAGVRAQTTTWPLAHANEALAALRSGQVTGAAVLVPGALS